MIDEVFLASVVKPPLAVELSAIVAGALAGAVFASRKGLDVVGILAIALVSGLGGGMIRDVLLASVPFALQDPMYLYTVAAASAVGFFFASAVQRIDRALLVIDALALGLFTAIGVQRGLSADLPVVSAVFLGVVTGVGGGLLRDLFTGAVPQVLRRGEPYAMLALIGAVAYALLVRGTDISKPLAQLVCVAVVATIRIVAVWRGWETPGSVDLTPARLRPSADRDDGSR